MNKPESYQLGIAENAHFVTGVTGSFLPNTAVRLQDNRLPRHTTFQLTRYADDAGSATPWVMDASQTLLRLQKHVTRRMIIVPGAAFFSAKEHFG